MEDDRVAQLESEVAELKTELHDEKTELLDERTQEMDTISHQVAKLVGPVVRKLVHAMTAVNKKEKSVEQRVGLLASLAQPAVSAPAAAASQMVLSPPAP